MGVYDHHQSHLAEKRGCLSLCEGHKVDILYLGAEKTATFGPPPNESISIVICLASSCSAAGCEPPSDIPTCQWWLCTLLENSVLHKVTCVFVALEIKHLLFRFPLNVPVCISHATPCWYLLLVWKTLVNHFSPGSALLYLRLLIWPVRNWWHNHSWLHVAGTEQKTQAIPKWSEQTKSSVTKKGGKHCFLVVYRNFKVLLSYKSFWATGLPQDGCAFEGESLEIRPWVIKEMLVPLQTKLTAEEIK